MIVFGLNLSHDEACAAVVDGEVKVAIENERLSRLKHNVGRNDFGRSIPFSSIHYCCDFLKIKPSDVDMWVVNSIHQTATTFFRSQALGIPDEKIIGLGVPGHHLAHAYSAYLCSAFEDAAVIVVDTNGGYDYRQAGHTDFPPLGVLPGFRQENYSIYQGRNGTLEEIVKDWIEPGEIGIGQLYMLYSAILQLTPSARGYYGNDDALAAGGKLMGYAAHDLGATPMPWPLPADGSHIAMPIDDFVGYCAKRGFLQQHDPLIDWKKRWPHEIHRLSPFKARERDLRDPEYIALGGEAQRVMEQCILRIAEIARQRTGLRKACFAGGNALNITALTLMMDQGIFEDVFIQPAANDAGNAIGAALYGYRKLGGERQPYLDTAYSTFLGRPYSAEEEWAAVEKLAPSAALSCTRLSNQEQIDRMLNHITAGSVVGVCRGRSEFGPRALGHRSLLATPCLHSMTDTLNAIKGREWYRPVAPMICEDDFQDYFEGPVKSIPFMTLSARVRASVKDTIPAVCHVDGSARVQTVTKDSDPFIFALLKEHKRRTGIPILINTSYNFAGRPIVETPAEAIADFVANDGVKCLVLNEYVLERSTTA